MTALLLIVLVSLGVVFLWGLLAPRSQWRVLVSWSYRDPHANEPSGSAYLVYRLVAVLGFATMVVSGILAYRSVEAAQPPPAPPPTAVERMWGSPDPVVVNRVITTVDQPPEHLVRQPILGYQGVSGLTRQPPYLFALRAFSLESATTENGYVGSDPTPGLTALDTADLVVFVAGDPACFPHQVLVRESDKSVTIAVYYGQADPPDHSNAESLADCTTRASARNVPTLLPIALAAPLKDRAVVTIDGDAIRRVALVK